VSARDGGRRTGQAAQLSVTVQRAVPQAPAAALVRRWVQRAAAGRRCHGELTVRIVDEAEGRSLNRRWRGKRQATNVLSFPYAPQPGPAVLGDIVLCAPVVEREAQSQGKQALAHWAHLVVHGTLHLLGHDHQEAAAAACMEALEAEILQGLGFPHPYHAPPA